MKPFYAYDYEQIIRTSPSEADSYFNKGYGLNLIERYHDAALAFETAANLNHTDFDAMFYAGMAYSNINNVEKATFFLNEALNNKIPRVSHYTLSYAYFITGKYEEALMESQNTIDANEPHTINIYMNMAMIYTRMGEHSKAIQAYNEAINTDLAAASSYNVFYYLGLSLQETGDITQAISVMNTAIKINPNLAPAYYRLGVLYLQQGDVKSAIMMHDALRKINPQLADKLAMLNTSIQQP